ncbi:MAG: hypothetical protein JWM27_1640 [Gemmatimonadetes bacterium]|nr:hypothetical protein [Gemmatimonadota bacterium]
MLRRFAALLAGAVVFVTGAGKVKAQTPAAQWSPPGREMPQMPTIAELQGNWQGAVGGWFTGVEGVSGIPLAGVRATGETTAGSARAKFIRFSAGARTVAVWTDRNGDGRADMVELFRAGAPVVQVVDADFNGSADVLRLYDASGALARESRL